MTKRPELSRDYFPIRWHVVAYMAVLHLLALGSLWFFSVPNLIVFLILYVKSAMGVTLGLHRMATHKSFKTYKWFERLLVTGGALAAQGGPIEWVGLHRHHHLHSDKMSDHHDSRRGFWWAHMGWMFCSVPAMKYIPELTKDLQRDPYYVFLESNFLWLQVPIGLILWVIGGPSMVLWGIPLRLVAVYHATWLVNSVSHMWGERKNVTDDYSTNNAFVALLTFGEGFHNNHHFKQARARHGLRWHQFDPTWLTIRLYEKLGLVWDVVN